ncbi:MAG: hypothetical protein M5U09_17360 [Gammaproteobacteria bacterium]|nr:hypothetical protein [Gammaproteobacteria bacterium]
MSAPANDQSVNLKHRLTGAVILIGIAVGGASLVLDRGDTVPTVDSSPPEPSGESFVSRIVSAEQRTGRCPRPSRRASTAARLSVPSPKPGPQRRRSWNEPRRSGPSRRSSPC